MSMICGGTSDHKKANEKVQKICDELKRFVEFETDIEYDTFRAITFKTQLVSGTNYFIKVHVGGDEHIHVRAYENLPCAGGGVTLSSVQSHKKLEDPIEYF